MLVLHGGALGDCVLALHVIAALRTSGSAAYVTLAARSEIAKWAAKHGLIDEATTLEAIGAQELFRTLPESKTHCRFTIVDCRLNRHRHAYTGDSREIDFVISFLGGPDAEVSRRLIDICGHKRVAAVDPQPTAKTMRNGIHITQQWAAEIRRLGFDLKFEISDSAMVEEMHCNSLPCRTTQSPNDGIGRSAHCQIAKSPNHEIAKSVLVHPGSGGRAKCCPIEALEALVGELTRRTKTVAWMIGPDEVERDGPDFRKRLEDSAPVIFEDSLEAAADLVAGADAFVGNDAGMTHLAALAGVTTVALFGPTDPRVWRPLGARCTVMSFPETGDSRSDWTAAIVRRISS